MLFLPLVVYMINDLPSWQDNYVIQQYETLDSTSSFARELITKHHQQSGAILALQQTRGRGRRKYNWVSPPGNLYFSFFFPVNDTAEQAKWLCYVTALAAIRSLQPFLPYPSSLSLKWPNDLLLDGRKLGGILIERIVQQGQAYIIIGIGINLKNSPDVDQLTTHLNQHIEINIDPLELAHTLLSQYHEWKLKWQQSGNILLINEMNANLYLLNDIIKIRHLNEHIEGINLGLDSEGNLKLRHADGSIHSYHNGSIIS